MGISPGGLNATGEFDEKNYYDLILTEQEDKMSDQLYQLDRIMAMSLFGSIPDDLKSKFNPLWQESGVVKATRRLTEAQTYQVYLEHNVMTEDMVAEELRLSGEFASIDEDYVKKLEGAVEGVGGIEGKLEGEGDDDKPTPSGEGDDDKKLQPDSVKKEKAKERQRSGKQLTAKSMRGNKSLT